MRVLHLDMPRGLSFTLKPWNAGCHEALGGVDGNDWHQIDLNFIFWKWLLNDDQCDHFGRLIDIVQQEPSFSIRAIQQCTEFCAQKTRGLECSVSLTGISFPRDVAASITNLFRYVKTTPDIDFFSSFFNHLHDEHMLLSGYSILSIGIDSVDGFVLAALLAEFVHRRDNWIKVCISRHQFENFSLRNRLDELVKEGSILQIFDAIVPFEEKVGEALASLISYRRTNDTDSLANIAVVTPQGPQLFQPSRSTPRHSCNHSVSEDYLRSTGLPRDRLIVLASIVRNSCYYSKCSFCIQNERYLAPQLYKQDAEIARALDMIEDFSRHGVRNFSFSDQALHPKLIRTLARGIQQRQIKIHWCGRMLFEPRAIDDSLLTELQNSGCRELLFGVESARRETLDIMNKNFDFDPSSAFDLLERIELRNIDVVLSIIVGFPTESDQDFLDCTLPFVNEVRNRFTNITLILNRFSLFRDTEIERTPERFGVVKLYNPRGPFDPERDFVDTYGRDSTKPYQLYEQCSEALATALPSSIEYSSISLYHRWQTGVWLRDVGTPACRSNAFPPERDTLIIGSNSYVGQNLARVIDESRLVLSSRAPRNHFCEPMRAPFLHVDLAKGWRGLSASHPQEIFVVSRPNVNDFQTNAAFASNLKMALQFFANQGQLRRIVFFSTQLVYATPSNQIPIRTSTSLNPKGVYEYFKAELEGFLLWLGKEFDLDIEIVRLPLAFGGVTNLDQLKEQLIHSIIGAIRLGARFSFTDPMDFSYGSSFVYVPDLAEYLVKPLGKGIHIRQPVSGDFTYKELQEAVLPFAVSANGPKLDLIRSHFFLENESDIPQRDLANLVEHYFRKDLRTLSRTT